MAGTRLSQSSLERALEHVCAFGDTDVFPHLCEIHFLRENRADVVQELGALDLGNFNPCQAIEVLGPKSRYGFRIVHQLHFVDTILFTAAAIEIGRDLENLKASSGSPGPFAYRFDPGGGASLFQAKHSYRDWLQWQSDYALLQDFDYVVFSDIADFYQRIYLHRIESCLDVATSNKGVKAFIEKVIKAIRSRQSYGIPVGGSASRLLAEAVLSDSDAALLAEGVAFTRFVDDFRIFVTADRSPYELLSFLAEQLFLTEGLTLNGQKTQVMTRGEYEAYLAAELPGVGARAEEAALETLAHDIYFSENEPDPEKVAALKAINLVQELEKAVGEAHWEVGRVKSILRALRIAEASYAADSVVQQLERLLPLAKEVVLFFDEMQKANLELPSDLSKRIIELAASKEAKSVPIVHAWLLEFFVRGLVPSSHRELKDLEGSSALSEKQMNLIRGRNADVNYFRRNKTRFEELSPFTKFSFILGASCLPKGEYEAWLGAIKGRMRGPLEGLFCDWAKGKTGQLPRLLNQRIVDHDFG